MADVVIVVALILLVVVKAVGLGLLVYWSILDGRRR